MPLPNSSKSSSVLFPQAETFQEAKKIFDGAGELYQAGRYKDAIAPAERALLILEKVLPASHLNIAILLHKIAVIYQASGDYESGKPQLERAIEIYSTNLGPNIPLAAVALVGLALLYQAKGDYAKALECYDKAIPILETLPGAELAMARGWKIYRGRSLKTHC